MPAKTQTHVAQLRLPKQNRKKKENLHQLYGQKAEITQIEVCNQFLFP